MNEEDTIAAIATPLGQGGLAVIRISGPDALKVTDRVFRGATTPSQATSHTLSYGKIIQQGKPIDEVMVAIMRAPRTFTREDVVEISCHGGILPAKLVLDTVLENGARLAAAGEFTKRAFLNGRIDLTQAEAVADVIHSQTELALAAANEQLAGKLSLRINQLRDNLIKTLAHIEAHIDFPDEDITPDTHQQLTQHLEHGIQFMTELLDTANQGEILRRGIRAAIIGRPNAGKSSLLNHLLGHERAIVSAIPGTTRDTIEETANIRGLPVIFVDTAGLRHSDNEIEIEGIRRSRSALAQADLVLHILDGSEPFSPADQDHLNECSGPKRILIRNKTDLPQQLDLPPSTTKEKIVPLSCQTGAGLDSLRDAIKETVWTGKVGTEMLQVMINSRHQAALKAARTATQQSLQALQTNQSLELVAVDLRIATNAVGEIVGKTSTEDLLDSIFSQFCIGK